MAQAARGPMAVCARARASAGERAIGERNSATPRRCAPHSRAGGEKEARPCACGWVWGGGGGGMARAALPPLVLVTNDDGVGAPGISALVRALARGGRFRPIVCAPARDRSGVSHSLTIHGALKAERAREPGVGELASVACHGSPADCIGFALSGVPFGLPEVRGVRRPLQPIPRLRLRWWRARRW